MIKNGRVARMPVEIGEADGDLDVLRLTLCRAGLARFAILTRG
jgi:hypothetical protein